MSAARSPRCSPTCATCNAAIASPSSSSITPGRAPAPCAPAKRCAAPPSSTPGAIPTSICAATRMTASPSTVEHRAAPAMPALTLELVQRADALALEVVERRSPAQPTVEPNTPRRPHRRRPRRGRPTTALRRSESQLPRPRRHPLRAHRRHDDCRPHHQIPRRLSPRRLTPPFRFRFPQPLQPSGSGTRKPIKNPLTAHQKV